MNATELVQRHIDNIATPFDQQDRSIYASNMVCEFPNAPEGHTSRLEGPDALGQFLARIGTLAPERKVDQLEVFEAGQDVIALFRSNFTVSQTGRKCSMPMILVLRTENGQIVRFREFYDAYRVLKVFGELPED